MPFCRIKDITSVNKTFHISAKTKNSNFSRSNSNFSILTPTFSRDGFYESTFQNPSENSGHFLIVMGTPEIDDIYIHTPIESPMVASLFEARNDKYMYHAGLQIRLRIGKLFSLFLMQNICCGYSKEPSQ